MAYDQKRRSNAEQKEAGKGKAASCATNAQSCNADTELAADNWTGAVFDPDATQANGRSYDPQTYTESYRSENGVDQSASAMAQDQTPSYTVGTTHTDHKSEQVAVASSNAKSNNAVSNTTAGGQGISASNNNATSRSAAGGQNTSENNDYVGYNMQTSSNSETAQNVTRASQYETAAEITPPMANRQTRSQQQNDEKVEPADGLGWTGMGLSILSLFFLPYLLAPIGMIIGYLAFRRRARTLGTWAMIIGAVAILGALVVYPYYVAR